MNVDRSGDRLPKEDSRYLEVSPPIAKISVSPSNHQTRYKKQVQLNINTYSSQRKQNNHQFVVGIQAKHRFETTSQSSGMLPTISSISHSKDKYIAQSQNSKVWLPTKDAYGLFNPYNHSSDYLRNI